tara:strand:+ start:999 stop:1358 length:360 start_codon:yes stop_codon:yes gene_type:complete
VKISVFPGVLVELLVELFVILLKDHLGVVLKEFVVLEKTGGEITGGGITGGGRMGGALSGGEILENVEGHRYIGDVLLVICLLKDEEKFLFLRLRFLLENGFNNLFVVFCVVELFSNLF